MNKDSAVTLRFKILDAKGKLIEEARQPMVYLHGGYQNTLPKIEEAMVKALYELERIKGRYALVTMCIGGGQGIAAIFERA